MDFSEQFWVFESCEPMQLQSVSRIGTTDFLDDCQGTPKSIVKLIETVLSCFRFISFPERVETGI